MKTRDPPKKRLASVLEMPPFVLARKFRDVTLSPTSRTSTWRDLDQRGHIVRQHVEQLSLASQYALLGLPEALVGLRILGGAGVPARVQKLAEEFAYPARLGRCGDADITDDWIARAIDISEGRWAHVALPMLTQADAFYKAARFFIEESSSIEFKTVHGLIYPNLDTLDDIFAQLDTCSRHVGGWNILAWLQNSKKLKLKLPYDLLTNYGAKYLRSERTSPKALIRLETLATQFLSLLRFDLPSCMGPAWADPAFVVEEITRHILRTILVDVPYWSAGADLALAEHVICEANGTVPGWEFAKTMLCVPEGTVMPEGNAPPEWVHSYPEPNPQFGRTLKTALTTNLGSKPVIMRFGREAVVGPRTHVSNLVWEAQKRLKISPPVLGMHFETFVRSLLAPLGGVIHGDYYRVGDPRKVGDVDALLQSSDGKTLLVFECKAMAEMPVDWSGGYHAALDYLRRVFLKSQEQLARFERTLIESGGLEIMHNGNQVRYSDPSVRVLRISVSMRTFGELHRPGYASAILSHFRSIAISTTPDSQIMKIIAVLQARINGHFQAMSSLGVDPLGGIDQTFLLDLALISGLCKRSKDADDLLSKIKASLESTQLFSRVIHAS